LDTRQSASIVSILCLATSVRFPRGTLQAEDSEAHPVLVAFQVPLVPLSVVAYVPAIVVPVTVPV